MPRRSRVCTYIDKHTHKTCPNLAEPGTSRCSEHPGRPKNAPWTRDRNPAAQTVFRGLVLERDQYTCTRCGHHDPTGAALDAHHIRPGYQPSAGVTLCNDCHVAVDPSARRR